MHDVQAVLVQVRQLESEQATQPLVPSYDPKGHAHALLIRSFPLVQTTLQVELERVNPVEQVAQRVVLLVWQISQFLAVQLAFVSQVPVEEIVYPRVQRVQAEGLLQRMQLARTELHWKHSPELR